MKKLNIIKIVSLSLVVCSNLLWGWEINTHRAIDFCAISGKSCGREESAKNLHWFTKNVEIDEESYAEEKFEGYTLDPNYSHISENTQAGYFSYILSGEKYSISKWNQDFYDYKYESLIAAGTILEDSLWIGINKKVTRKGDFNGGEGRFNYHFYDPQDTSEKNGLSVAPLEGKTNENAINWAKNSGTGILFNYVPKPGIRQILPTLNLGKPETYKNNYSYEKALEYYKNGFTKEEFSDRKTNRAKMFVSLGHLLHLLNDMNVPAHTRDDAHPLDDPLEKWMRGGDKGIDSGGFKIINHSLAPNNNKEIMNAVKVTKPFLYNKASSFIDFYKKEAEFTGKNFFSEDSIVRKKKIAGISVGTSGTFTGYEDYEPTDITTGKGLNDIYYLYSNSSDLVEGHKVLAMYTTGIWYKLEDIFNIDNCSMMFRNDTRALVDNGINLIPRAVANAEGFVNYFFRGRIEAKLEDTTLTIKNISDTSLVATPETVTFQKSVGVRFSLHYDTDSGRKKLSLACDDKALIKDDSLSCKIVSPSIYDKENWFESLSENEKNSMIVVFDGDIGSERGISVTKVIRSSIKLETPISTINSIILNWNKITDDTSYTICKSETEIEYGAKCEENGGVLLYSDTNKLEVKDDVEEDKTYYFKVKENNENLWSKQIEASIRKHITFLIPDGASISNRHFYAKKGDTISFYSLELNEYIKDNDKHNEPSTEEVTYNLYYQDMETEESNYTQVQLDKETGIFSFNMPSSHIRFKRIVSNIGREAPMTSIWITKTIQPSTVTLNLGTDITLEEEKESNPIPFTISDKDNQIKTIECSTTPIGITISNTNENVTVTAPKYSDMQSFTVKCVASDDNNELASDEVEVTVTKKPVVTPTVFLDLGSDDSKQEETSITYPISTSGDIDKIETISCSTTPSISVFENDSTSIKLTIPKYNAISNNLFTIQCDAKDSTEKVLATDSKKITITQKSINTPVTSIVSTLKKTGQTIAYTKYDDGFYEKGITPNYTEEQDKILDRTTGLLWQNNSHTTVNNKVSWSEAKAYCSQLIEGLRLPTRQELSGLVRYDKYNPSIDDIFDYTTADYYWTEDVSLRDENKVWAVSFNEGTEATVAKTGSYSVRCVKKLSLAVANAGADQMVREKESITLDGSHSPNREDIVSYKWSEGATALGEGEKFSISTLPDGVHKITLTVKDKNGKTDSDEVVITVTSEKDILKKTSQNISYAKFDDGFYEKGVALNYAKSGDNILDKSTGLIWQDSDSGKKLWGEAEGYCASLDGHWRLPTRRELSNLVSYNRYSPSIDDIFSSTTSDYYWTIDTNKRDHDKAWAISFSEGVESALAKSSSYYVRCVQNNLEPIANAGVDQLVVEGQPVVLRATESSRRELIKSYVWLEGDKELGQGAVFEPENMIDGEHEITLVVKDESGNELSRDSLRVTIISDNRVLKQTGQNISYAKFDDGYYEKGIALNYTKRDDDILDRTTGLLWQDTQESKENTNSWQDAKEYCNSLDGHWRLPTRKELSNLVLYNRYNPSIDDIFSFTTSDYYWTIDTSIRDRDKAWAISFSEGVESTVAKSSSYYARCVQSDFVPTANAGADILITKGTPTILDASNSPRKNLIDSYLWENSESELGEGERLAIDTSFSGRDKITLTITDKEGRTDIDDLWLTIVANNKIVKKTGQTESYADYDDGDYQKGVSLSYSDHGDSVTDNATGLEWKDDESTNSVKMTWKEANEYCSRDDSNWRLPTRHELSSLIDYSAYNPSINSSFDNTASDYYWSVDTSMRDNDKAWAISFSEGVESTIAKSGSYYVRCINAN